MSQMADGGASPLTSLPPLVGRQDEIELIGTFVGSAVKHGGALLLPGDPGVGKSVLLDAAAARAQAAGARVLRAAGAQFEADVSFSTLSQLLQPLLGRGMQSRDHGAMARLDPLHAGALLGALGWSDAPPAGQLVLWTAVLALIREEAADKPLLIVLDDLQWACLLYTSPSPRDRG